MKTIFLSISLVWLLIATGSASLQISEFLASNDSDLSKDDWIEIHNTGEGPISLEGYHLTDREDEPTRWAFPNISLEAQEFLLVYASGDDLADPAGVLHANFKVSASGGYLGLTGPNGEIVSSFEAYPSQRTNISYGLSDSGSPVYFEAPTPGAANDSATLLGFVADTKFSVDRGYYDEPIEVEITSATEGATILYTTDGRVPSKGSVFTGPIGETYEGPIPIDGTTTLRAIALKDGFRSSNVDTQTYLFLADVVTQTGAHLPQEWDGEPADYEMDPDIVNDPRYRDTIVDDFKTLPSLSITMEPDDFFSTAKGIYPGKVAEDGIDKPCSAELLHPDGKEGFQIDCAVRIVGQTSPQRWKIKKLSMRLRFDKEYGPGTLRYPLYEESTAVEEFNTLTVDARHNNTWAYQGGSEPTEQRRRAQYLRDQTAADLHRAMGGFSPHGRYVHTYVNGVYWGMYNLHERPDDAFNATYQGGEREDWNDLRHGTVVVSGSRTPYTDLHTLARDADTTEGYAAIQEILDIDDFVSYMMVNLGLANGDWGPKNYYVSYNPQLPDGKWRYHSWDAEKVFQNLNDNIMNRDDSGGPTALHQDLTASDDYRIRFADHVYKQFFNDGVLSVSGLRRAYKRRTDEIDRAIILESARWGDAARGVSTPYTKEDWDEHRDWIMNTYFPQRVGIAIDQFKEAGLLGDLELPTFEDHGGHFEEGYAFTLKKSIFAQGNLYYTIDGSDPRLPGGKLSTEALAYEIPVTLAQSATVKARLYKGSVFGSTDWSPLLEAAFVIGATPASPSSLRIAMINYHPAGASDAEQAAGFSRKDFEFLGLSNVSDGAISLFDAEFTTGIRYRFDSPASGVIAPGETAFLVKNVSAFEARYGAGFPILGQYEGSLSNDGERLALQLGETMLADFEFNDAEPWPASADGEGAFLVLTNPTVAPDGYPSDHWRASTSDDLLGTSTPGSGDSDGDGYLDALETVMGSDPSDIQSVPHLAALPSEDGVPIFEVSQRIGTSTPLSLEMSSDLKVWEPVTGAALVSLPSRPSALPDTEILRYQVLQMTRDAPWTERYVRFALALPNE